VATAHASSSSSTIASGSSQATLGASSKSATASKQGSSGSKQASTTSKQHARTQASHKHSKTRQSSSTWHGAAQCATHGHTKQAAPCSGSASQGKQRRGQQTWRRSGGGVCSTGRSSVVIWLRPGWSRYRGELGGDDCVVELEGRRAPGTGGRIGTVVELLLS
jgi:hypothetical protein